MQYWIELGILFSAAAAMIGVAYEGLRIYAAWRRNQSQARITTTP